MSRPPRSRWPNGGAEPALVRSAMVTVVAASSVLGLAGLLAGAVRVLPWVLDPKVPWLVAAPFARGLAAVAVESALLVGWPVGWALASARFVESGESRALQALGESPASTLARLAPQGVVFTLILMTASWAWGRDARAPGDVANELLDRARATCETSVAPAVYEVPFTKLTWLCKAQAAPRLVGSVPGGLEGTPFSARSARLAPDFRAVQLQDARVRIRGALPLSVHVSSLTLRGLAPWAQASVISGGTRASVLALTAWITAVAAARAVLSGSVRTYMAAVIVGASGSLFALGLMRLLERSSSRASAFGWIPLAGGALVLGVSWLAARLRGPDRTARE